MFFFKHNASQLVRKCIFEGENEWEKLPRTIEKPKERDLCNTPKKKKKPENGSEKEMR